MKLSQDELKRSLQPIKDMYMHRYMHYKGDLYTVVGSAIDCNTNEPLVIYIKYDVTGSEQIRFSRPFREWNEFVDENTRRFERVSERTFLVKDNNGEIISGI